MTWGLRFLVIKWVHNMLGFRASSFQVVLKAFLSLKPSRKVPAVEVPFGGSKHESSSSALKSAIHVKSLLSDLLNLLQGNFYLLSTTLRDLKGVVVLFFVLSLSKWSGFRCFCLLPRHSSRGRSYGRGAANFEIKCLTGLYHAWFPCKKFSVGRKISNLVDSSAPSKYQICVIPTSEVKLKSKKKSD